MAVVIGSLAAHIACPKSWPKYNDIDLLMWEDEFLHDWATRGKWSLYGNGPLGTTWIGDHAGRRFEVTTVPQGSECSTAQLLGLLEVPDRMGVPGGRDHPLLAGLDSTDRWDLLVDSYTHLLGHEVAVTPLRWLYALKRSHVYKRDSPHFEKTVGDLHRLADLVYPGCSGAPMPPGAVDDWVRLRERETYDQPHPILSVTKADFFSDAHGVEYIYDHDSLHLAMAQGPQPAYMSYKKPGAEVLCSKELFHAATAKTRLNGVLEECYVLALERSQIPYPDGATRRDAFLMALKGVCTRITSGWFRAFAVDHYFDVLELYDDRYVDVFKRALAAGIVLPAEK